MTLKERYESLLHIREPITDRQKIAKIKMLYMKVLYELAIMMKKAATDEIDESFIKSANKVLTLMLENCILQDITPEYELDPFHYWPVNKKEKGYSIATFLDGYSTKQFVKKEPITFVIFINQLLDINLLK